jgi:phosphoribosylformylglycinamidine cyclo-ligase
VVEKERIIDGSRVQAGDVLLGLASSGPHSNGYSLIRKVIEVTKADLGQDFHGRSLGDSLLEPTRIYVKSLLALIAELPVSALAHITGGGIVENLPRVLPDTAKAIIHTSAWTRPPVFDWLQQGGAIAAAEMYRTFNCGIGMIVCVRPEHADKAVQVLRQHGETVWRIGEVAARSATEDQVLLSDS